MDELGDVVARFGDARRTVILADAEERVPEEVEEEVADEDVVVTVSHEGFVKRMPMHLYRRRVSSGKALAGMEKYEEDYIERLFVARTQGWILAFTEGGQVHFLPVLDVPESARASRGQSIYSLLAGAERSDRIVAMVPVDDLERDDRYVVFLSRYGILKRTVLSEFSNPRSGGIIAAGVKEGDRMLDVAVSDGEAEVMLMTREGRAIRFAEEDVSVMGRTAQGVKGIDLRGDDEVVGMLMVRREATVLTVTDDGLGKRTPVGEFPLQKRGGLGTLAVPSSGPVKPVVTALEVLEGDRVMLVTAGGQVSRVAADAVPVQGRRTQGKRMVKLAAGDRVVEVTRVADREEGAPAPALVGGGAQDEQEEGDAGEDGAVSEGQSDLFG